MEKQKRTTLMIMIKQMSRKKFFSLFSLLLITTLGFWGLVGWLFSPVPEPKTTQVQGIITNVNHYFSSSIHAAIYITINDVQYRTVDGSYRALNSKVEQINVDDFAVIQHENGHIITLKVNDTELLSMKTYLKEERIHRSWIGGIITILGIPLLALSIYYPFARYKRENCPLDGSL